MEFFQLVSQNFLSPAILFFILGIIAGSLKSDLEIPESISRYLSIYLMMSIGLKGGCAIANTPQFNLTIYALIVSGVAISFILPFIAYAILRITTHLDNPTAAAVSAHYGSISMVTFATATSFISLNRLPYEGYIVAILALMEGPAIISGLFIAHRADPKTNIHTSEEKRLSREIFTNGAILLLFGSFVIGCITGQSGLDKVAGFLDMPFQGILCLFLLDMGLLVANNLHKVKNFNWQLSFFGIYMPLIGAGIGTLLVYVIGVNEGTGTLFVVLCASASYIAVPAAMRLALPEANPGIYVPLSLAITFPFNIIFGIPMYFSICQKVLHHL